MDKKFIFTALFVAVVLIVSLLIYKAQEFKRTYEAYVDKELEHAALPGKDILTEEDIRHLPEPVQKYLRYVNAVGKEKVRNFRVAFNGEFKTDLKRDWAKVIAQQYTDLTDTTRLYFMQMKMFGLPVIGLHRYTDAKATMLVKLAGLITVADGRGEEMNKGETVTVFNDMCIFAPASLIDKRIEWESIDPLTVKATFNNKGYKITASLYFNDRGELINYTSDDRYYSPTGKTYQKIRWSTPCKDYKDYNSIRIPSYGEAIWSFPEGEYSYARFNIREIDYNIKK